MTDKLTKIRDFMSSYNDGPLDAFVIYCDDWITPKNIADRDRYIQFLTGFSGSHGLAIVTMENAFFICDPDFYDQVMSQLYPDWTFIVSDVSPILLKSYYRSFTMLPKGVRVGFDPKITSHTIWEFLIDFLQPKDNKLIPVSPNPVDLIWTNRPLPPMNPITPDPCESVESFKITIKKFRDKMRKEKADYMVIPYSEEVCFLLKIQSQVNGQDVAFQGCAIISMKTIYLFMDSSLITRELREYLNTCVYPDGIIELWDYNSLTEFLHKLVLESDTTKIWMDTLASKSLHDLIPTNRKLLNANGKFKWIPASLFITGPSHRPDKRTFSGYPLESSFDRLMSFGSRQNKIKVIRMDYVIEEAMRKKGESILQMIQFDNIL